MDFTKINEDNYGEFLIYLKTLADDKYREFHSSIVNNSHLEILGIRSPMLKSIAKEILKGDYEGYLRYSGNKYYEEVMIRGFVTAQIKVTSYEEAKRLTESFLPYIDNWAVCDGYCSTFKRIKKFMPEYFEYIGELIIRDNVWHKRVALVLMLNNYLIDEYIDIVLQRCIDIYSEGYYVQMAQAWLLATAFIDYPDKVTKILKSDGLSFTVKRMTIQKCIDSFRVPGEKKEYLKQIRAELKKIKKLL